MSYGLSYERENSILPCSNKVLLLNFKFAWNLGNQNIYFAIGPSALVLELVLISLHVSDLMEIVKELLFPTEELH